MKTMKRTMALFLSFLLILGLMITPALAADWPQFLGDPATQGVSNGDGAVAGEHLSLRWDKNTGSTWSDVPGTPIVVGDYVYYYSSQYLRKLELATGKEVASALVYGKPVNQFFINIAYGEGKIFVPCQTDNLDDGVEIKGCFLRVFDAETLQQLYVTESIAVGQPQSPVMCHDGYVVTGIYGRNGVYAGFTAEDEDPARSDEIKSAAWRVDPDSKYGFSFNGAAFVGDYCYFGCDSILYVVKYKTGAYEMFDIGEGHSIRSTIAYSSETQRLYVACNNPDGGASIFSCALGEDGMPDKDSVRVWKSGTENGGTQSTPVIYKGRLYIGGGGSTMGSNEPFHVVDANTMEEIYSVPILSKGSAGVSAAYATKENNWKVYIYMVPYAPNAQDQSEIWIISDCQGQTEANYEVVDNIAQRQYCSQSVVVAKDGSLIWYNDAGRIYCYENTEGRFDDTQEHWARENIAFLARRKIVNGMGNNLFQPNGTLTRAHFVQLLANMSGEEISACTTNVFRDVNGEWYSSAIAWALERGIVDADRSVFEPNTPIAREDMAVMLYRYMTIVAEAELPEVNTSVAFTDAGDIAPYAAEAVSVMQRGGMITGMSTAEGICFAPKKNATRAEVCTLITRFYNAVNG